MAGQLGLGLDGWDSLYESIPISHQQGVDRKTIDLD